MMESKVKELSEGKSSTEIDSLQHLSNSTFGGHHRKSSKVFFVILS